MSISNWSENIIVVELQDDPTFSDDMTALVDQLDRCHELDVVMNLSGVMYVNSSNIAKLLKARKKIISNGRRLVMCGSATNVWGLFLVTGLDKVFEFADDVANGLATVQLAAE